MIYSKYQLDIFDKVKNTNKNIVIAATAGSGKTTTIIEASKLIPKHKRALFLAFNKSIVDELKKRLPQSINCSTIHSLGMRSLMSHFHISFQVSEYKTFNMCDSLLKGKKLSDKDKIIYKFNVANIINLLRLNMSSIDAESISQIDAFYDVGIIDDELDAVSIIWDKLTSYNESFTNDYNMIDFTDMVYLPIVKNISMKQYDVVLVDELQDLNTCQQKFIERLVKPYGRIIAVGDKRQAIYGFAGADIKSFEAFENRENTLSLPLSVCYRCAKSIVSNAKTVYDDIEYFDQQQEGIVRLGDVHEIQVNDMVVCRNVRPLISLFFHFLKRKVKSTIKGKDIEQGLIKLLNKVKDYDKSFALTKLGEFRMQLITELRSKGIADHTKHPKYINFVEKCEIISVIASECETMKQVEILLHEIFEEKRDAINMMTVHKSKGLESDRVFYIEKFNNEKLIPSKYAIKDWERKQEQNLLFVCYTRAKKEFVYAAFEG